MPDLVSIVLGALSVAAVWFGAWLTRKGKREDVKIQQADQAFKQIMAVSDARLKEIERRDASIAAWEARWGRQMDRCRGITDALSRSILALMAGKSPRGAAEQTLADLEQHNIEDHSN